MSACGRRQAGISQQTQSFPAIVVPPLLMKPSLTNAHGYRLVNSKVTCEEGKGRLLSSLRLLFNLPAALRKMTIAALTQFAVYCCWHARGDEAWLKMGSLMRKADVVLLYRSVKLLEWL